METILHDSKIFSPLGTDPADCSITEDSTSQVYYLHIMHLFASTAISFFELSDLADISICGCKL